MTQYVIWFDSTPNASGSDGRRPHLTKTFGATGDWLRAEGVLNVSSATHVAIHLTDFCDPKNLEKRTELLSALRTLQTEEKRPRVVKYSGSRQEMGKDEINRVIAKDLTGISDVRSVIKITRDARGVSELQMFLEAQTESDLAASKATRESNHNLTVAIDLVAEVVAWLSVTQHLPIQMTNIHNRLTKYFGTHGENLVGTLVGKAGEVVRTSVNEQVAKKMINRRSVWQSAGLLVGEKDSKP